MSRAGHWIAADWPVPDGVIAGCTLRTGGTSRGVYRSFNLGAHVGDAPAAVADNRQRLLAYCGLPSQPAWLTQVHGAQVAIDAPAGAEADAMLSSRAGFTCAVLVADCLPVLFSVDDGSAVAAAHAGWRGLAGGVLENTIASFAVAPSGLLAWLGPAISQEAFEVGEEVREAFLLHDSDAAGCFAANARGRWQADLYALARRRLNAAGVERISGGDFCTAGDPARFFSYRRDGQCGRMAAFVCRKPLKLENS